VMLTAGVQDHRVPIWVSAKMTARLQAAGRNKGSVLLRAEDDAGHGGLGLGRAQEDAEWADSFAFLFWQLGAAGFQPTK
jgi:prolyl oligopeptidase